MNDIIENKQCLACGSDDIHLCLDLGNQPLANNFLDSPDDQPRYPLAVNLCHSCYHLQLTHTVNPEIIYSNYLYVTGTSNTMQNYSKQFASKVDSFNRLHMNNNKNVLDIGCNDGTQLNYFKELGYDTYGIDPAENLHDDSVHNITCAFFGPDILSKVTRKFDNIVAQNVFAHNPNPLSFLNTVKEMMTDDGVLYIQTSQANMVLNNEFDTIYHEHINFFNVNSMMALLKRAGLYLYDVQKPEVHGTSYLFVIRKFNNSYSNTESDKLCKLSTYKTWADNVQTSMSYLIDDLDTFRQNGFTIVGYGAAAKGNTLLNYIDEPLDYIIDDNELKQNTYAPGTNTPVVSIDILEELSDHKILFMPLAWNFFNEIRERILQVRDKDDDRFLRYFPEVQVV